MRVRLQLFGAMLLVICGCDPDTVPCGTFTYTGAPHSDRGIDATVNFDFEPTKCQPNVSSNLVAYVQIIRIIDRNTGNFLSPNSQQTDRIVTGRADTELNGWAIDRLSDRRWGFYGRNNNGNFASTLTPGSDSVNAVLRDRPSGWPDDSRFDAVSVPVCLRTESPFQPRSPCVHRLLGYYFWQFYVDEGGAVNRLLNLRAKKWVCNAVDQSVIEWNNDSSTFNKNSFPTFVRAGC